MPWQMQTVSWVKLTVEKTKTVLYYFIFCGLTSTSQNRCAIP
jgi:hypothetical protein